VWWDAGCLARLTRHGVVQPTAVAGLGRRVRPYADVVTAGSRLRGLIVDWGGVLTASLDSAMSRWASDDGVDFEHFRAVMRSWLGSRRDEPEAEHELPEPVLAEGPVAELEQAVDRWDVASAGSSPVHRLERGELTPREFEQELAAELGSRGSTVDALGLLRRMLGGLGTLDPDMIDLVRHARAAGLKTALLSNSWGDHYPEELWDGLFDAVVISGRVGMRKPDPAIFEHTAELLGLEPVECVMVDDLPQNVRGAAAAGMVGVRHTDYATTLAELEALFDIRLSDA
jgi:epoxide hydrolase-like predicted phosphatase